MSKIGLIALLLVTSAAHAAGVDFRVTAQEYRAFPSLSPAQQHAWLATVMRRGCPVQAPITMERDEAIAKLATFKPDLPTVLSHMRGDCESAIAAQVANTQPGPTSRNKPVKFGGGG